MCVVWHNAVPNFDQQGSPPSCDLKRVTNLFNWAWASGLFSVLTLSYLYPDVSRKMEAATSSPCVIWPVQVFVPARAPTASSETVWAAEAPWGRWVDTKTEGNECLWLSKLTVNSLQEILTRKHRDFYLGLMVSDDTVLCCPLQVRTGENRLTMTKLWFQMVEISLKGRGPFTVFAPSSDAFSADKDKVTSLTSLDSEQTLSRLWTTMRVQTETSSDVHVPSGWTVRMINDVKEKLNVLSIKLDDSVSDVKWKDFAAEWSWGFISFFVFLDEVVDVGEK